MFVNRKMWKQFGCIELPFRIYLTALIISSAAGLKWLAREGGVSPTGTELPKNNHNDDPSTVMLMLLLFIWLRLPQHHHRHRISPFKRGKNPQPPRITLNEGSICIILQLTARARYRSDFAYQQVGYELTGVGGCLEVGVVRELDIYWQNVE